MNLNDGTLEREEIAEFTGIEANQMQRATNTDDPKKLCAELWDGALHPETGEKLNLNYELHGGGECLYAEFYGKGGDSYNYYKTQEKSVWKQACEDKEQAKNLERGGR